MVRKQSKTKAGARRTPAKTAASKSKRAAPKTAKTAARGSRKTFGRRVKSETAKNGKKESGPLAFLSKLNPF